MAIPANSPTLIDSELISKLRDGDQLAFEQIYHRYSPPLYLNILKMVKDELATEELIQELFTRIWQKRESLYIESDFKGYLYRVAQNLVHDFYRNLQRDKKMLDYFKSIATENYDHIEKGLYYKESEQLLKLALEQLTPQQRNVYQFCKIDGYTYKQTAEKLGISSHTVKEYLSKANIAVKLYLLSNLDVVIGLILLVFLG